MVMSSGIVQEYASPSSTSSPPTLTYDSKIAQERIRNGITRPIGKIVSWHANPDVEQHHFGQWHPMKPWRLTLTKHLVMSYGMHSAMDMYLSRQATKSEILEFHDDGYIDFLSRVSPNALGQPDLAEKLREYSIGDDCPIFDGLFDYCSLYSGASIDAARKLSSGQSDIAINWSGGLHHAQKGMASGFCYINDIVLAILQLLRTHPRVLYIDIDVHHGDGVEAAFASTDRVLTLSFHKYDKETFFPGTGSIDETGPSHPLNPGAHHSLNVPLNDGITDIDYTELFRAIVHPCVAAYRPSAIVLQCGADSLGCDRLGCFNLNIPAHGECLEFVKRFNIPLLVVGGGGYTAPNVARLWAYETSICIDAHNQIDATIPAHTPTLSHFAPNLTLFPPLASNSRYENRNTRQYLDSLVAAIHEQLRYIEKSPSVQMQVIPPDIQGLRDEIDAEMEEERQAEEEAREERDGTGGCSFRGRRGPLEKGFGVRGELVP
jgi:histone deacetylase HOS2